MLLYVLMVLGVIASLIYMIAAATPTTAENNFSTMVNKQTFSKAIDYGLDKLIFDIVNKETTIKDGCYKLGRFVWDATKKWESDTIKLEYIAPLNVCSEKTFSQQHKEQFWDYNLTNGGLSYFVQDTGNGKYESSSNNLVITVQQEKFNTWYNATTPNGTETGSVIFTIKVFQISDMWNWIYSPSKIYEFTGWRNA